MVTINPADDNDSFAMTSTLTFATAAFRMPLNLFTNYVRITQIHVQAELAEYFLSCQDYVYELQGEHATLCLR